MNEELQGIIDNMISNGESQETMNSVIGEYERRAGEGKPNAVAEEAVPAMAENQSDLDSQPLDTSLEQPEEPKSFFNASAEEAKEQAISKAKIKLLTEQMAVVNPSAGILKLLPDAVAEFLVPTISAWTGAVANVGAGVVDTAETGVEALWALAQDGEFADNFEEIAKVDRIDMSGVYEAAEEMGNLRPKKFDKNGNQLDAIGLIQSGRYAEGSAEFINEAIGSAPMTVLTYALPGMGSAIIGAGTFGAEFEKNLKDRPEEAATDALANAAIKGGSEVLFEFLGGKAFRTMNKLAGGPAKAAMKEITGNYYKQIASKFTGGFFSEGLTEAATGVAQLAADEIVYDDKISAAQYARTAIHSGIVGGLMGGPISGATTAGRLSGDSKKAALSMITPKSWRDKQMQLSKEIDNAAMEYERAPEGEKIYFKEKMEALEKTQQANADALSESWDSKTRKEQIEYADNLDKADKELNIIGSGRYTAATQADAQGRLDTYYKNMEQILTPENIDVEAEQEIGKALKASERIAASSKKVLKGINKEDLTIEYVSDEVAKDEHGMGNQDAKIVKKDGKATVIVNKDISALSGNTTALGHEVLHYMISKSFKSNGEGMVDLANSFKGYLRETFPEEGGIADRVEERIEKFYTDPKTGKVQEGRAEEYFTVFSDLVGKEKIELNETRVTKLKNSLTTVLQGFGIGEVQLNDGKQVFDFIRSYSKNINEKSKFKALNIKLKSDILSDTNDDDVNLDSESFEDKDINEEFKQYKKGQIPESLQIEAAVAYEPLAKRVISQAFKQYPEFSEQAVDFDDLVMDLQFGTEKNKASSLLGLAKSFDPSIGSFGGYAKSLLAQRAKRIFDERFGKSATTGATSLSEEGAIDIEDETEVKFDLAETKPIAEALNIPKETISKATKLVELAMIKAANALKAKGKDVTVKKRLQAREKAFNDIFSTQLFKDIKDILGKNNKDSKAFSDFISGNNFEALRDVALKNIAFQNGSGPSSTWNQIEPSKKEFVDYYEGKDILPTQPKSTKSDRKKTLNNAIARQIAKDARYEFAETNPDKAVAFAEETGETLYSKSIMFDGKKRKLSEVFFEASRVIDPNPREVVTGSVKDRMKWLRALEKDFKDKYDVAADTGAMAEYAALKEILLTHPHLESKNFNIKGSDSTGKLDLEFIDNRDGKTVNIEVKMVKWDARGGTPHGSGNLSWSPTEGFTTTTLSDKLFSIVKPLVESKADQYAEYAEKAGIAEFPFSGLSKDTFVSLGQDKGKGLDIQKNLSVTVKDQSIKPINDHYSAKAPDNESSFIYYFGENQVYALNEAATEQAPLLDGGMKVEVRLRTSGTTTNKQGQDIKAGNISVFYKLESTKQDGNSIAETFNSVSLDKDFNNMLQRVKGVKSQARYSDDRATKLAAKKGGLKFFVPYSAEDFVGLTYPTLGKGQEGEKNLAWYKENLLDPYSLAISNFDAVKAAKMESLKALKSRMQDTPFRLSETGERGFTNEEAVRVYLWNKTDNVPDTLAKKDVAQMLKQVKDNKSLKDFANAVENIAGKDGYPAPEGDWLVGNIAIDMVNSINTETRAKFLENWQANVDVIYSKENLNKLKSIYGERYTEALENILQRMKTGRNRPSKGGRIENAWMDWVNNSVGTVMFLNFKSAILQLQSMGNYLNWSDNNPLMAAKALLNFPKFAKDWSTVFNSDFVKLRRKGLQTDISAEEIVLSAEKSSNKIGSILAKLLQKGFAPTQFADAFAIATGGASFYRNRINSYMKQGMSESDAEAKAMIDLRETSEESQQSSRPDRVSMQQSGGLGRLMLAFANTPMQYTRLTKKAALDLANGRGDWKTNASKMLYYGALSNIMFSALQQGMFKLWWDEDEEFENSDEGLKIANGVLDTLLRGAGLGGNAVSVAKNMVLKAIEEQEKNRPDYKKVALAAINLSPPISTKVSKLVSVANAFTYNKLEDLKPQFDTARLGPGTEAAGKLISATTNVPLDRVVTKINNIIEATNSENQAYQQIFLALGWSEWSLGMKGKKSKIDKKDFNFDNLEFDGDFDGDLDFSNDFDGDFEFDSPNKRLDNGVAGKANNDGTIEIDPNLSPVEREKTIVHEEKHMADMESGKLAYDDDNVTWNGKKYKRENGKIMYNGKALIEGHPSLPWEKVAYAAEPSESAIKRKLY